MKCAWQAYLNVLPPWMREETNRFGQDCLQEVRMRLGRPPELISSKGVILLQRRIASEDLQYCVNAASQYSPWASTTISRGYITAPGGHRIGICGRAVLVNGKVSTISDVTSACIRLAGDYPGISASLIGLNESTIIIGAPGCGKTTLLRDIVRQKSNAGSGSVAVVDERGELFPAIADQYCFPPGLRTEVLTGCEKTEGLQMLIRTMNPVWIAVDEVTDEADCTGLIHAAWCGVKLLATAHAADLEEFLRRQIYQPLVKSGVFSNVVVMRADKSWHVERMNL